MREINERRRSRSTRRTPTGRATRPWRRAPEDEARATPRATQGLGTGGHKAAGIEFAAGSTWYALVEQDSGDVVLYFLNPRVLLFGIGTSSSGSGPVMNDYSICFPMP
jgi:hypothetical protein